jgi:hypothetical protein
VKSIVPVALSLLVVFLATTWWALESSGVAVIRTVTPEGSNRETHVWYVEQRGEIWLEAGSPGNAWFKDVQVRPTLRFFADGRARQFIAEPVETRDAHERIRLLLREKYGLRDWWVNLLVDTSGSIAVRLVPPEDSGR